MKPKRGTKQKKNIKRIGSRKSKLLDGGCYSGSLHQVEISASRDKKNQKCHQRIWCQ